MYKYSKKSMKYLNTCHRAIQIIMLDLIKIYDVTILCGYRTQEEQFELYKKGRKKVKDEWIKIYNKKRTTECDGFKKLSAHNYYPSCAIDIAPSPIDWEDENRFNYMAGIIIVIACKYNIKLEWGGWWKKKDLVHFELKNKNIKI